MVGHVAPGGRFDFSLTYRGLNKEEKRFDELIQQYRNKYVVTIVILLFLISSIYVDLQTSIVAKITVFDSIVLFFFTLLLTVILGDGIKYLSAWWNIKKHWKKEFAS